MDTSNNTAVLPCPACDSSTNLFCKGSLNDYKYYVKCLNCEAEFHGRILQQLIKKNTNNG